MSSTSVQSSSEKRCCSKHYPRCPYTFTHQACDDCYAGCNEPGIGSSNFQGNSCGTCSLVCLPIHIFRDILCCVPMIFGCFIIEKE